MTLHTVNSFSTIGYHKMRMKALKKTKQTKKTQTKPKNQQQQKETPKQNQLNKKELRAQTPVSHRV